MPLASVSAVAWAPLLNVALAPLPGAVNVTVVPTIGLLLASFTVTFNAVAKTVLTFVLCGVPAVAEMLGEEVVSAAPLRDTFPEPDAITHFTLNVCPAPPAR